MKNRKTITSIIAILISLGCVYYVLERLLANSDWLPVLQSLHFSPAEIALALLVVCLMPLNWLIESYKWQLITHSVQTLSMKQALCSVLQGVSVGMITPNRVGELGGRALAFDRQHAPTVVVLASLVGLFQLSITILAGMFSLLYFVYYHHIISPHVIFISAISLAGVVLLLALLLYKGNHLLQYIERFAAFCGIQLRFADVALTKQEVATLLALSALRYALFCLQFYLLLQVFAVPLHFWFSAAVLSVAYLFSAAIPSWAITDLGIKGAAVVFVLQNSTVPVAMVVVAVLVLWFINVALPSLLGSVLLLKHKRTKL